MRLKPVIDPTVFYCNFAAESLDGSSELIQQGTQEGSRGTARSKTSLFRALSGQFSLIRPGCETSNYRGGSKHPEKKRRMSKDKNPAAGRESKTDLKNNQLFRAFRYALLADVTHFFIAAVSVVSVSVLLADVTHFFIAAVSVVSASVAASQSQC
jgi:hypothetical protein